MEAVTDRRVAALRAGLVSELIASLANIREVLDADKPAERKAVVQSFLAGIRVDRAAGRAVLRWYRLPQVAWVKLVTVGGIELDRSRAT